MATKKTVIHPLLRVLLAAGVYWLIGELMDRGTAMVMSQFWMQDWIVDLAGNVLRSLAILLVMRFVVFFTKASFSATTLRMMFIMGICAAITNLISYFAISWDLLDVVLVFRSDSLAIAAMVFALATLTSALTWCLAARSAKNNSGYIAPLLMSVVAALLTLRVAFHTSNVLFVELNRVMPRDMQVFITHRVPEIILFIAVLLSQWNYLYKGQLDTLFKGRRQEDRGPAGNEGATRSKGKGGKGRTPRPKQRDIPSDGQQGDAPQNGETPFIPDASPLTVDDMDRYWREEAAATRGGGSVPDTDLTREFEAAMRESGGASHTADVLRDTPSHFVD